MLIVFYGINGVGKDRIAKEILKTNKDFLVISQSRLLMYHLGIVKSFISKTELKQSTYQTLETIKEKEIKNLSETLCRKTILDLSNSGKMVFYLSHLNVVKFFQNKYKCSPSKPTKWIKKEADALIFINANSSDIFTWRKNSKDKRNRQGSLANINLQKKIAKEEWQKLIKNIHIPHIVIQNRSKNIKKESNILLEFIKKNCLQK